MIIFGIFSMLYNCAIYLSWHANTNQLFAKLKVETTQLFFATMRINLYYQVPIARFNSGFFGNLSRERGLSQCGIRNPHLPPCKLRFLRSRLAQLTIARDGSERSLLNKTRQAL